MRCVCHCPHGVITGQCNDCLAITLETEAALLEQLYDTARNTTDTRRRCPECHGTTQHLAHPADGGSCPHCFDGYLRQDTHQDTEGARRDEPETGNVPPPTLDEVLQAFVASGIAPAAEHVREWITRYPQFSHEIIAFATTWIEVDNASPGNPIEASDIDHVVNRTMRALLSLPCEAEAQSRTSRKEEGEAGEGGA